MKKILLVLLGIGIGFGIAWFINDRNDNSKVVYEIVNEDEGICSIGDSDNDLTHKEQSALKLEVLKNYLNFVYDEIESTEKEKELAVKLEENVMLVDEQEFSKKI